VALFSKARGQKKPKKITAIVYDSSHGVDQIKQDQQAAF
jgi:hypothetical protein